MMTESEWGKVVARVPVKNDPRCISSTSEKGIYQAIILFFKKRFPDVIVVRGKTNRVSLPDPPCVVMQIIGKKRLSTKETRYTCTDKVMHEFHKVMLRVDFWGSKKQTACDLSTQFSTLWNDDSTSDLFRSFNAPLYPLYTDDDKQIVLIDDQEQYVDRYIRDAYLEYHPEIKIPQESATEIILPVALANNK